MIKRGEPNQIGSGFVQFVDTPVGFHFITEDPIYNFLGNRVSSKNTNIIKQDLACKIKSFVVSVTENFIYDVDAYAYASVCQLVVSLS